MYESVLQFWFHEISPAQWWKVDPEFDRMIVERFSELHGRATRSELFEWRAKPRGRMAEIIVLDQFSRNMHRDDALAYANDTMALALAQEAVAAKADLTLSPEERELRQFDMVYLRWALPGVLAFLWGSMLAIVAIISWIVERKRIRKRLVPAHLD